MDSPSLHASIEILGLGLGALKLMLHSLSPVTFCSCIEGKQIKVIRIRKLTWLGRHCWFPCGQGHDINIPQSKLKFQFQSESPEILLSKNRKNSICNYQKQER